MARVRANNIDIEYEAIGREGDPAILLIMGIGQSLMAWRDLFCLGLAEKGYRVIRFDNRDAGRSTYLAEFGAPNAVGLMSKILAGETVAVPYSLDDMAADAAALLSELGVERAHIVGASLGGMIAQLVAVNHPAKTKSLVSIMSTTGRRDLPPAKPEALAALLTPPASAQRHDLIVSRMAAWRVLGSPGFPQSDDALRAFVERLVDYAPYQPAGLARQLAAILHGAAAQRPLSSAESACPGHSWRRRPPDSLGVRRGYRAEHSERQAHRRARDGARLRRSR